MKRNLLTSVAVLALAGALTGCGSSSDSSAADARTQACRAWTVEGAAAARTTLALAQTEDFDTAEGTAAVKRLHDALTGVAAVEGLSDAEFKPFGDLAKVAPATVGGIFDLGPDRPARKTMDTALSSIDKLCG